MLSVILAGAVAVCAIQCVRVPHLLVCIIWLAATSALLSVLMAVLGAAEVAVIELSVGAGLVTVLFVFAVGIAGEPGQALMSLIPKPLVWALTLLVAGLFIWFVRMSPAEVTATGDTSLVAAMWEQRKLDTWMQLAFLFAGVLGILGLLAEAKLPMAGRRAAVEHNGDLSGPLSPVQPRPLAQVEKEHV